MKQLETRRPNTIATITYAAEKQTVLYCHYLSRRDPDGGAGLRVLRDVQWRSDKPLSFTATEAPRDLGGVLNTPQRKTFNVKHVVRVNAVVFDLVAENASMDNGILTDPERRSAC
jgi:hypothetical protein